MRWTVIIALALMANLALADAPYISLRPKARPGSERVAFAPVVPSHTAPFVSLRPVARPIFSRPAVAQVEPVVQDQPRPKPRLTRDERRAARKALRLQAKGAVCGDSSIQGEVIGRVPGKLSGCGINDAVRVTSISNVALSQSSVMNCTTARTLKSWIDNGLTPAVRGKGGGVVRLKVASHYACRTRNSRKGAKISEHAKGNAIDISAFQMRDGSEMSVLKDWGRGSKGRSLKRIHKSACGPFGTVLGPKSDSYHRNHFHFDVARHRGGPYCR